MKRVLPLILTSVFMILLSCNSVPRKIPEDMQPEEFFKNAQSAVVDWGNYKRALLYYNEFIKRYPDMKGKILEAEYEIALIYYKKENYHESEKRFNEILEKYKTDDAVFYQEWPKILSEKILKKMKEEKKYN